jgi:2-isopropylmalate synthase
MAYFGIRMGEIIYYGAGAAENISYASINALVSSLNIAYKSEEESKGTNKWDADNYNKHANFVSALALPVVELLSPQKDEMILDLGCGDGTLAQEIAKSGASVIGVDLSEEMVRKSRQKGVDAYKMSVTDLKYIDTFDAIFSNAMLHWVKEARLALENIYKTLKNKGRFVAEFGGIGNAFLLVSAMEEVFMKNKDFGSFKNPWYFPSAEEYTTLLGDIGFSVEYIKLIPRPTPVDDIKNWLDIFANGIISHLNNEQKRRFKDEVREVLEPKIYSKEKGWVLDYVRLRVKAIKEM